ncbi:MAG TPA: malate synthase A [Candidatus Limnocylindrales bacterium]|nr:malate synthase A [Candidatus Limnocylindrales bacterium]
MAWATGRPAGVEVVGPVVDGSEAVLTDAALAFLAALERRFRDDRRLILGRRVARQAEIDAGARLGLLAERAEVRLDPSWRVAETPPDLLDRRVEITGPAEPKMVINALNSGARCFMADFEDALSPTWANLVGGQAALIDAVRHRLAFRSAEGKTYRLGERVAQLLVRPRGWHLPEAHIRVDGEPMSGSLFDAGLYLFHNAQERVARGTAPYLYLPKLQSHVEARLWNDVFLWAQDALGIPRGTIRATVLIETLPAAFEMEEILFELREHSSGLNAGRWDYLFSTIKTFRGRHDPTRVLPDRGQVTMTVPFMRAYTERLVLTCHRRRAPAMGGMAAFIPNRRDPEVTETAMRKVREDKERESHDGFDGTWVAHPDLVALATEVFDGVLGSAPNQLAARRSEAPLAAEVPGDAAALLDLRVEGGRVTDAGVRLNVNVGLQYLDAWLGGNGAAAINNLMEDAATAEISRSQLWQWRTAGARLDDGSTFGRDRYLATRAEELALLGGRAKGHLADAADLLDQLVLDDEFVDFLTLGAYPLLG